MINRLAYIYYYILSHDSMSSMEPSIEGQAAAPAPAPAPTQGIQLVSNIIATADDIITRQVSSRGSTTEVVSSCDSMLDNLRQHFRRPHPPQASGNGIFNANIYILYIISKIRKSWMRFH